MRLSNRHSEQHSRECGATGAPNPINWTSLSSVEEAVAAVSSKSSVSVCSLDTNSCNSRIALSNFNPYVCDEASPGVYPLDRPRSFDGTALQSTSFHLPVGINDTRSKK